MVRTHRNSTPAYRRIQNAIRAKIESGELKPGDPVTSERELARMNDVSLMTARHALAGLEQEGIVERRVGAGTFVAVPKIQFNKLMSYTEQTFSRGLFPRTRVLTAKIVDRESEVAARLSLPVTEPLVKIERLRLTGEEPLALETCYLSAKEFDGLVKVPWARSSLFRVLEQEFGVHLAYADEEVNATEAEAKVATLLKIEHGGPVLRIRQVIYSNKGKPAVYVVGFYRSERHTLFIRRFR